MRRRMTARWAGVAGIVAATLMAGSAGAADGGEAVSPHVQWTHGPTADPNWFPIGVWAQDVRHADKYKAMGVNFYLSLAGGPTEEQLAALKRAGLRTICHQNQVGLAHKDDPTIMGWMHGDEPDNFTRNAEGKWVPKATPQKIIADYQELRRKDPTRPVLLNLGQGVANDAWKGGWAKAKDYVELVKGCDIVSYDIYPLASDRPEVAGKLELIPLGVGRLREYSQQAKIVWFITEASHIKNPRRMASAEEMRSEVWMALIRGATGIVYFCHQWEPNKDFAFPANDPATRQAVTGINRQVLELAPVLNSPTLPGAATADSADKDVPIDLLVKRHAGAVYVLAASQRKAQTQVAFAVKDLPPAATAEVLGEGRKIQVKEGAFSDAFAPYAVHLYKIAAGP